MRSEARAADARVASVAHRQVAWPLFAVLLFASVVTTGQAAAQPVEEIVGAEIRVRADGWVYRGTVVEAEPTLRIERPGEPTLDLAWSDVERLERVNRSRATFRGALIGALGLGLSGGFVGDAIESCDDGVCDDEFHADAFGRGAAFGAVAGVLLGALVGSLYERETLTPISFSASPAGASSGFDLAVRLTLH